MKRTSDPLLVSGIEGATWLCRLGLCLMLVWSCTSWTQAPPAFQLPKRDAQGRLALVLVGERGATYRIESSPNLKDWTTLRMDVATTGRIEFTEPVSSVRRFFRASRVPAAPPRVFNVRDYGAVPNDPADSGAAIRRAIRAAMAAGTSAEVVLEPGVYRVKPAPGGQACFPIEVATNLVVRGAGKATRLLITDPTAGAFMFTHCQSGSVSNLVVDYDPPPFCQGTIRDRDTQASSFDVEIEAGFPTPDSKNFLNAGSKFGMVMDRATRRIRSGAPDYYWTGRWESRGNRVWRFFATDDPSRANVRHMRVGDSYVHLARGYGSVVFAQNCNGIRIENLTVHASPSLAVGLVANRGEILVRGLEVRFPEGSPRLLTTDADGIHCQQNRTGPVIEDCYFEGMADDAINIYTVPYVLRQIRSATQWLVSFGPPVQAGDRLQVLNPLTGEVRAEVKVVSYRNDPTGYLVTLSTAIAGVVAGADHRSADTIYNLDASGAGFRIRRNHMNGNRRHGCLLAAGDGVVEDNLFEHTTGAGVMVTNEPDWPEGPMPRGTVVRRNRFVGGGTCLGYADSPEGAALRIRSTRLGYGLGTAGGIRNLEIVDNDIQDQAGVALFVGGASQVTLSGNRISASPSVALKRNSPVLRFEQSLGIALLDTIVSDPRLGTTSAVEIGPGVPAGDAGVRIFGLKAALAPGVKEVVRR